MDSYQIEEILNLIETEATFEGVASDNSFYIKIEEYVPYVCAAIHAGSNFRSELAEKSALSKRERWYEEDPHTDNFIVSLPIVIKGNDSRYEYDLNRNEQNCIYEEAWGKQVWVSPLTAAQREESLRKYNNFYKVAEALIRKLESKFNACLVFDIHSYNYKRYERTLPVFNLGTESVDRKRFASVIDHWMNELRAIEIPNIENVVAENDIFQGNGNFLRRITANFNNTLVFATEVKKIYCDENSGVIFPMVIEAIEEGVKAAILNTVVHFAGNYTNLQLKNKQRLLSKGLDEQVVQIDRELFDLVRDFEVLSMVNPINLEEEKRKFLASPGIKYNPEFRYNQIEINPYAFKKALFHIPVERIKDIDLQHLYKDIINSYADKIDLINTLGSPYFLYNSLRYFGEPNETDIANAQYLLHIPQFLNAEDEVKMSVEQVRDIMSQTIDKYGFNCTIEVTDNITAAAQVINSRKTLMIKESATFSLYDAKILANHEIGVHMVTTINARLQPLRVFQLGLPINTLTQEGLAVLSEYLSGSLNTIRLKELGLRTLAIRYMLKGNDFRKTFLYLVEEHNQTRESAFYLATRIFRGGGFTKDHLYLRGFRDLLKYYKSGAPLEPLLIGKTSLPYADLINEMIERKQALAPQYVTHHFLEPVENSPILDYVIEGIR